LFTIESIDWAINELHIKGEIMKTPLRLSLVAGLFCASLGASNFDVGISGSERGIDGFNLSIGDYYRVPYQEVVMIERSIPRDEMSVVYFLADQSHQDARFISNLRLRGISWWDITFRLGLDPRILYVVDTHRYNNPPYGKAYGYHEASKHRLRDGEIVDLVNVRFLSEHHRISPDEVIDRRRSGERYDRIDEHYRDTKDKSRHESKNDNRSSSYDKGHGQKEDGHSNSGKNSKKEHGDQHDR
jgi:hypothetical protein